METAGEPHDEGGVGVASEPSRLFSLQNPIDTVVGGLGELRQYGTDCTRDSRSAGSRSRIIDEPPWSQATARQSFNPPFPSTSRSPASRSAALRSSSLSEARNPWSETTQSTSARARTLPTSSSRPSSTANAFLL